MSAACYKSVKSNFAEETDDWFFFHTTIQIDRSFVQSFFCRRVVSIGAIFVVSFFFGKCQPPPRSIKH
jgi:hypothetical protein